jgi:signal transduction histidine kinase
MHRVKAFVDHENLTFVGRFFLVFAVAYTLVVSVAFYFVVEEWKDYAETSMLAIEESSNTSISETCTIMSCHYIEINGEIIYRTANNEYTEKAPDRTAIENLLYSVSVIPIKSTAKNVTFGMSLSNLATFYINVTTTLYVFLMSLALIFLIKYVIRSNIKSLVDGASNTASLHNKNMAMLAEQLHHELNTPLSVVKELCDKVFGEMAQASTCKVGDRKAKTPCVNCTMPSRYSSMQLFKGIIDNNIKQAFVFIERMADVKQVRYSNGNKSLYDIAKATFDIMGVYNRSNYTFDIDDNLKRYRLNHFSGLKNHEFMNILLNHIKNSLEAGSSHIVISLNKVVPHKMSTVDAMLSSGINFIGNHRLGFIGSSLIVVLYKMMSSKGKSNIKIARIALIDNGSGIPKEFQDRIFNLNASTKNKSGVIRGAGLFLNRQILRESKGDLILFKTGPKGTTFILDVPAENIYPTKTKENVV